MTQERGDAKRWDALVHPDDAETYTDAFSRACLRLQAALQCDRARAARRRRMALDRIARRARYRAPGRADFIRGHQPGRHRAPRPRDEREVLLESERAARSDAETATRAKDEFLATLSHELRTPLSVIVLWSRILARKHGAAGDELRKGLALIIDNGMALSQLIGDLLDMSRIVAGRVTLDLRPVERSELVSQAVTSHRPAVEAQTHHDVAATSGADEQDRAGRSHAPAAGAVEPAGQRRQVHAGARPHLGRCTQARRRSSGDHRARRRRRASRRVPAAVFTRFRQADSTSARRHGGLGLGLAIVRQLVELHGGTVQRRQPWRRARLDVHRHAAAAAQPRVAPDDRFERRLAPSRSGPHARQPASTACACWRSKTRPTCSNHCGRCWKTTARP